MRIAFILIVIIFNATCFASPTINGPTGLIEMPSADSIAYKQINVAVDYTLTKDDTNEDSENTLYYKFNLGSFENWELGILGGSFLDEGVYVNMKYFLMTNEEEDPLSISAGVEKIGSKQDISAYLVTSKKFQDGLTGHFGFKAYFQNNLYAAAMIGVEYFSNETVSFLFDALGEKTKTYVLNAGIRVFIEEDISLRLYLIDVTKSRPLKETLYTFGLSFSRYI